MVEGRLSHVISHHSLLPWLDAVGSWALLLLATLRMDVQLTGATAERLIKPMRETALRAQTISFITLDG